MIKQTRPYWHSFRPGDIANYTPPVNEIVRHPSLLGKLVKYPPIEGAFSQMWRFSPGWDCFHCYDCGALSQGTGLKDDICLECGSYGLASITSEKYIEEIDEDIAVQFTFTDFLVNCYSLSSEKVFPAGPYLTFEEFRSIQDGREDETYSVYLSMNSDMAPELISLSHYPSHEPQLARSEVFRVI